MIQKPWLLLASVVVILGVLASAVPLAEALCPYPAVYSSINDPYEFVRAGSDSLGWVKQAGSRVKSDDLALLIYELKQARSDYECASAEVEGFATSTDKFIRENAQMFHKVYEAIVELHNKFVSELVQMLDDAVKGKGSPGRVVDHLSEMVVRKDKMLKMVLQLSATSMYALVEWSEQGKATERLRITESQRQDLMKRIEKAFGSAVVRSGPRAGQTFAEGAAATVHQFLADQKWRSADRKTK